MNLDVKSPGRALFSNFPLKKQHKLSVAPVTANPQSEDPMEISIVMSDISQQPSVELDGSSMLDPVTDPRPSHALPVLSKDPLTTPINKTAAVSVTPRNSSDSTVCSNYASMSNKDRMLIIQKSVERLSQVPQKGTCRRADQRCGLSGPLSPNSTTMSKDSAVEPVTPFQPTDPSRMFTSRVDRSGTVCRFPYSKRPHHLLSDDSPFLDDQQKTHKGRRTNLLKRMGDYKPKEFSSSGTTSKLDALETTESQETVHHAKSMHHHSETTVEDRPESDRLPPECSIESSHSCRIPAGKNASSVTSSEIEMSTAECNLSEATRRLSLEDGSPENDRDSQTGLKSSNQPTDRYEQGFKKIEVSLNMFISLPGFVYLDLLMDSVFTTNTHGPVESDTLKEVHNLFEDGVQPSVLGAGKSYFDDDSTLPFDPNSSEILNEKHKVMVLKPRKLIRPSTPTTPNVRRSTRNRIKPVREYLGEKAVYTVSPGGSRTLAGVNEVEVKEERWVKVRTASYRLAYVREHQLADYRRLLREKRRRQAHRRKVLRLDDLHARHRKGLDLEISADSIVTSSDEEDSD
ncbi:hypothetical protein DICVIV_07115 [Dictyocaulus viviparus]|uniref:Uncharacterized protein n=1 Tax=Dictyocaulus viviparus TaxID=29172 RepID=A0A0D8XSR9_DICVI|nr:hypothetical protein DICVIV_07115 [Dictyocaulus viviparus]